jgi:hypothetical protein
MKRRHVPVLLALILPALALTGCPKDAEESIPSGSLGDADLVLKGTVYEDKTDFETMKIKYEETARSGTVVVYTTSGEKLGEGALTTGDFDINVTQKPTGFRSVENIFDSWEDLKVEPADAQIAEIELGLQDQGRIRKREVKSASGTQSDFSYSMEEVTYLYADKDVTITLGENVIEGDNGGGGKYKSTSKAATLKLTKGWNALHYKYSAKGTATSQTSTTSVSVGNPDIKWVLYLDSND